MIPGMQGGPVNRGAFVPLGDWSREELLLLRRRVNRRLDEIKSDEHAAVVARMNFPAGWGDNDGDDGDDG